MDLKTKLENAGQKAVTQKKERQTRVIKGAHLAEAISKLIAESGCTTEDQTSFTKVTGAAKHVKLFVAIKGGRVDLSGFSVDGPAIVPVSREEAKAKHLGRVQAQVNFDADDAAVLETVRLALAAVKEAKDPEPKAKPAPAAEPVVPATEPVATATTDAQ